MSEQTRREVLRNLGITITLASTGANLVTLEAAQHVHNAVAEEKKQQGPYRPKYFNSHEFRTLSKLADLIMPADEHSKGALDAAAPEFIDFLASRNQDLANIYTGGLAWIDHAIERRYSSDFVSAKPEQQTALLDLIAYRKNDSPELATGIRFFTWVRNMVVDAFYTSPVGIKDLGFMGNAVLSEFKVPEEAIQYALKRSPFA